MAINIAATKITHCNRVHALPNGHMGWGPDLCWQDHAAVGTAKSIFFRGACLALPCFAGSRGRKVLSPQSLVSSLYSSDRECYQLPGQPMEFVPSPLVEHAKLQWPKQPMQLKRLENQRRNEQAILPTSTDFCVSSRFLWTRNPTGNLKTHTLPQTTPNEVR